MIQTNNGEVYGVGRSLDSSKTLDTFLKLSQYINAKAIANSFDFLCIIDENNNLYVSRIWSMEK